MILSVLLFAYVWGAVISLVLEMRRLIHGRYLYHLCVLEQDLLFVLSAWGLVMFNVMLWPVALFLRVWMKPAL